ncbi:type II toxin-antitoxin system HicB family antitoxin [bacterium]|nr:type II toxin-antitoxin system HicB family antitoxin [bacterium]
MKKEEDGRFSAHVPVLPGCHSWGNTRADAISKTKEAIQGYLEVLEKRAEKYRQAGESVEVEV